MFESSDKKKNQVVKTGEVSTTVIGQGVSIEGQTFRGVGTVSVSGVYLGEMFVDGHVVVGQTGEIRGNITANTMIIAGTVIGNIVCGEELHITETAITDGDIQTNSLIVDQGAGIKGTISTRRKPLVEPINLDDAVKNMHSSRKSIEATEDTSQTAPKNGLEPIEEKKGFFSK